MKLPFPENKIDIDGWAKKYNYPRKRQYDEVIALKPKVKECGFLTKAQLLVVAEWKSPHSAGTFGTTKKVMLWPSRSSLLARKIDRTEFEVPTLLDGVEWSPRPSSCISSTVNGIPS